MFMRYYGGGVGHVDLRKVEAMEVDLAGDEDEGLRPGQDYDDTESDDTGDDIESQSDMRESSDEEALSVY